jgi:hypothetical protein
MKKVKKDMRE